MTTYAPICGTNIMRDASSLIGSFGSEFRDWKHFYRTRDVSDSGVAPKDSWLSRIGDKTMNDELPSLPGAKAALILTVVVAALTLVGSLGGAYLGSHRELPPLPPHQFELWTPSSMNPKATVLVVFRYDRVTGSTWQLIQRKGATGTVSWTWVLVSEPSPPQPPSFTK